MTAWTPNLRIEVLPPGLDHLDPATVITDWVDYSISATRGTSQYIDAPYPMSTTVSLLFDQDVIPDIVLGSWVKITAYNPISASYLIVHSGNVTDISSSYRYYGLEGFVLEWQFTLTSAISVLQNTTWYNDATYTNTTVNCLDRIIASFAQTMWNEVNATTTWANYGPLTWDEVDASYQSYGPDFYLPTDSTVQALTSGYRNVWDDFVTLVYGVYGFIYESPNGDINMYGVGNTLSTGFTITPDMINTDISGGYAIDQMRNQITINEWDNVSSTYYDSVSINDYTERSGTLTTFLTETTDAANVAQRILDGLAYPLLHTKSITLNLLNPIFTDVQREFLLFGPLGQVYQVEAPLPMGGTLDYLCIGCNYDINKDAFLVNLTLAPVSQVLSTPNWDQIDYNYTWTSYGVAFPTQKWQDL